MNCQSFENVVDDLAREQLVEPSVRQEASYHSEECAECAMRLADERMLTLSLRALAREMQSAEAPVRVERNLLLAFRERQPSQHASRSRRWSYLSAAAAVLLVGFAIGIVAWNRETPVGDQATRPPIETSPPFETTPSPQPVIEVPSLESGNEVPPASELVAGRKPANSRSRRRAKRETKAEHANNVERELNSNTEVATDFMPLGYVNSLSLQDGGSVVRVELPRSTIVSMGFAVNMDRYGERVKADVLMGADGLARAIRFVQ